MKRLLCALLAALFLILPLHADASASGQTPTRLYIDGREAELRSSFEMNRGVLYASLEDIAELLGIRYTIIPSCRGLVLRLGPDCLRMTMGSACADRNGEAYALQGAPFWKDGLIRVPLADVAAAFHMGCIADGEIQYLTRWAGRCQPVKGIWLPILMYHAVSDDIWGESDLFVKPAEMEKQLAWLQEHGYTTVTFEDMPRIEQIEKPVFLTFDDGYRDNYTELFPLLQKYQAKATVFVITDAIGNERFLTEEMIAEMSDSGLVSIQSHTDTHPNLSTLAEEDLRREMETSLVKLLRITGRQPFVLCYPEGRYSDRSLKAAEEYYAYGLKMNGGTYLTSSNLYRISRIYISRSMGIGTFASRVRT